MATNQQCQIVSEAAQIFAGKIYPVMLSKLGSDSNVIASSFSLSSVLSMLHLGAAGDTEQQLRQTLALSSDEKAARESFAATMKQLNQNDGSFTLEAANRLFVQQQYAISKAYLEDAEKTFKAGAQNVEFADSENARQTINKWVEARTRDKIKDLIPSGVLNALTRLVLVNAIYFKGTWNVQFEKHLTQPADFHVSKTQKVKTPLMQLSSNFHVADMSDELKARVLMLPYKGKRLSMLVFLPMEAENFSFMENALNGFDFNTLESCFSRAQKVNVYLPKFKIETTHHLNEPLKTIGLTDMFVAGKADFSKLSEAEKTDKNLFVALVIQKAFVEVNEEGTEAAAATAAVIQLRCAMPAPSKPIEFRCDRPFVFAIRDTETGLVLFTGRVMNPQAN